MANLCKRIKQYTSWDDIYMSPAPYVPPVHGFRININHESEEEIKKAIALLKKQKITVVEDKKATTYSSTIKPGDRTLRVIHAFSIMNLKKMWKEEDELKKSSLAKSLKEQSRK